MTKHEKRKLRVIFNKYRERSGVLLYSKSSGVILRNEVENLYNEIRHDGEIIIIADPCDYENGVCVPLSDIGFATEKCIPLSIQQARAVIRHAKRVAKVGRN